VCCPSSVCLACFLGSSSSDSVAVFGPPERRDAKTRRGREDAREHIARRPFAVAVLAPSRWLFSRLRVPQFPTGQRRLGPRGNGAGEDEPKKGGRRTQEEQLQLHSLRHQRRHRPAGCVALLPFVLGGSWVRLPAAQLRSRSSRNCVTRRREDAKELIARRPFAVAVLASSRRQCSRLRVPQFFRCPHGTNRAAGSRTEEGRKTNARRATATPLAAPPTTPPARGMCCPSSVCLECFFGSSSSSSVAVPAPPVAEPVRAQ
jgi:hypothetical protein